MSTKLANLPVLSFAIASLALGATAFSRGADDPPVGTYYEAPCYCKAEFRGHAFEDYGVLINLSLTPSLDCSVGYFVQVEGFPTELLGGCETSEGACSFEGTVTVDHPGTNPFGDMYEYQLSSTSYDCGDYGFLYLDPFAEPTLPGFPHAAVVAFSCSDCRQL